MPTISVFYGITIFMHLTKKEHNPPHIHAKYEGKTASFFIANGEPYKGRLPQRAMGLVKEFVLLYQKELQAMWDTSQYVKLKGLE